MIMIDCFPCFFRDEKFNRTQILTRLKAFRNKFSMGRILIEFKGDLGRKKISPGLSNIVQRNKLPRLLSRKDFHGILKNTKGVSPLTNDRSSKPKYCQKGVELLILIGVKGLPFCPHFSGNLLIQDIEGQVNFGIKGVCILLLHFFKMFIPRFQWTSSRKPFDHF